MTLGRTASNAIKIKTDEEGGGLRAVNCACCAGVCGCATTISGDLLETLRVATTGTCNGASPTTFYALGGGFFAFWFFPSDEGSIEYRASLTANANCFAMSGDNALNLILGGPSEGCCPTNLPFPVTCADTTFTINGQSFIAHTENYGYGSNVPPPTFVFS